MLQLKDNSPFKSTITLFPNEDGVDSLYVVVKATFNIHEAISIAEEQLPVNAADVYWGEPGISSIRYASDLHLCKPSTDVVLVGQAWAPMGRQVNKIDVRLTLADKTKTMRVFGDRQWRSDGSITSPKAFQSMPITYERAFGGFHFLEKKQQLLAIAENPVGVGFRGKRSGKEMTGTPLPNIEDPKHCISYLGDKADPTGFGFVAPSWIPRRSYAGTYDAAWQKQRAPYLPTDFNPRFFNTAHPDLVFNRYLQGGEPVQLYNLSPQGPIQFTLPICRLQAEVRIAGNIETPPLNMETVLIEPDQNRFSLLWRAVQPCDKKALKIEQITVSLLELQGVVGTS